MSFKLKKFVSASSQSSFNLNSSSTTLIQDGDDVSNYYLNTTRSCSNITRPSLLNSDSNEIFICDEIINTKSDQNKQLNINNNFLINKAMKFAQHNDLENLQKLIEFGVSINATDEYGWSLLMVAACAGSDHVVKYLLSKNARRGKRDCKGNTALFLACQNKHTKVVDLLIKKKDKKLLVNDPSYCVNNTADSDSPISSYFCETCNVISNCTKTQHITSIAHQLNESNKDAKPTYGIPRNNIGFQMLLQQGWDEFKGLGRDGTGLKYPIKPKQKKDRSGIGEKTQRNKRSAHQNSKERKEKFKSLKMTKQLLEDEKLKERKLRKLLNEQV